MKTIYFTNGKKLRVPSEWVHEMFQKECLDNLEAFQYEGNEKSLIIINTNEICYIK